MTVMRNEVLVVLHVVAAVFIVGPLVAFASVSPRQVRSADLAGLRATTRGVWIYGLASVIVAVLGVAMVRDFGPLWIWLSLLLYVVALGLTFLLLALLRRTAVAAAAPALPTRTPATRTAAQVAATSGLVSLLFLAIVVLMVLKPA